MGKEFYIGQPLIIKGTGEKVIFAYDNGSTERPCKVLSNGDCFCHEYYDYKQLKPSTEFKFSEIIAGLEQGYFEVGTEFRIPSTDRVIIVEQGADGLYLERLGGRILLTSKDINSTWRLVESRKEMTLEEIEAELGYKIKLKDNGGN